MLKPLKQARGFPAEDTICGSLPLLWVRGIISRPQTWVK